MVYVKILKKSDDRLHLTRQPGLMSWAILGGLVAIGLGAAYFSTHNNFYEALFVLGATIVGLQLMDDWEECVFDRSLGKVTISKLSAIEKILSSVFSIRPTNKITVDEISEIIDVNVDDEDLKFAGRGHCVLLRFASGYELSVTETYTLDDVKEHEKTADLIRKFLNVEKHDLVDDSSSDEDEAKKK